MQYVLCPRCKFKVPANKHLCSTCGYVMPVFPGGAELAGRSTVVISPTTTKPQGFWASLFGVGEQEQPKNDDQDTNALLS